MPEANKRNIPKDGSFNDAVRRQDLKNGLSPTAELTSKRFFLTRKEQKQIKDQPLSLCPNCKEEDKEHGYLSMKFCKGYRKHIIFDLLKDKADLFYTKMLERKITEEQTGQVEGVGEANEHDLLSQDSENYNEEYKLMVQS